MRMRSGLVGAALTVAALVGAAGPSRAQPARVADTLGESTVDQTIHGDARTPGVFSFLHADPGEPYVVREELATAQAGRSARRRSLAYFGQLTDFQLSDEESPARVEPLDPDANGLEAAWRPQEALIPHMTDLAIRQMNAFKTSPVAQGSGVHSTMDFVVTTGDSADNQQRNEVQQVVALLDGSTVNTNSGSANPADYLGQLGCPPTPTPALAAEAAKYTGVQDFNDYAGQPLNFYDPNQPAVSGPFANWPKYQGLMDRAQVPFQAEGLDVPSYVAFGNHDGLAQGNQAANAGFEETATGCAKPLVPAQNLADPNSILSPDTVQSLIDANNGSVMIVPPDPDRQYVSKAQYKALHDTGVQPDAHGFAFVDPSQELASDGAEGYYTWVPVPGVRFIALDTLAESGVVMQSPEGNLDDPQFQWLKGVLDEADAAGQLVIAFAHHAPQSMTVDLPDEVAPPCTGVTNHGHDLNPGCDVDPRDSQPIHLGPDLVDLFHQHPNVIAYVTGHSHVNDITPFAAPDGESGFWSIRTAAEADWPHQHRVIEVMDNEDGTLSIFTTILDGASPIVSPPSGTDASTLDTETLASIGRTLGYNDPQKGGGTGEGVPSDRNTELLLADPLPTSPPGGGSGGGAGGGAGGGGATTPPGSKPPPPTDAATVCASSAGFDSVSARGSGRGVRFSFKRRTARGVGVDVFQASAGRTVLDNRLVARFDGETSAFRWNGRSNRGRRALSDGTYFARYKIKAPSGRLDTRRVTLRRSGGRFRVVASFYRRDSCDVLQSFKLGSPAFGGTTGRPLPIAYRVAERATVSVRVLRGGRVVRSFGTRSASPGKTYRLSLRAAGRARGQYRVRITVRRGTRTLKATLAARRL